MKVRVIDNACRDFKNIDYTEVSANKICYRWQIFLEK
ncbi:hypothetical protein OTSGILL_1362 [Orientia tsutsugamushi str. Gilliam]|uniref:Uncharacterized protein n=1 Tax=Orientia tsutsugamushi str. Gilliam TaxID=1359184 RepID=A0A0F3MAL2_ORITS|nr:hypothetical protein OTSGILL_1362 [Orientia tsutsugamushi str. Gilliam]KJV56037.1 hypothetical protein OTSKARP_0588 [Orientia tsutsugamushi str. Karp]